MREEGWTRSVLDGALWFRWTESIETGKETLTGVIVGHVDDLLFTGNDDALQSLMKLGDKLGYGSVESEISHGVAHKSDGIFKTRKL